MKIMAKKWGCLAVPLRCENCESTNLRHVEKEEWINNTQSSGKSLGEPFNPGKVIEQLSELARGKQSYFVCEDCGHYDRFTKRS